MTAALRCCPPLLPSPAALRLAIVLTQRSPGRERAPQGLFAILFAIVAFQPLCKPMNATHLALFGWLCANAVQSAMGFVMQQSYWNRNIYKRLEVVSTLILAIFFVYALALRDWDVFAPLPDAPIADGLIGFLDDRFNGTMRRQHGRLHTPPDFTPSADDCGWTGHSELLRTLLAFAAVLIALQATEIFSVNPGYGALMVCAFQMLEQVGMILTPGISHGSPMDLPWISP